MAGWTCADRKKIKWDGVIEADTFLGDGSQLTGITTDLSGYAKLDGTNQPFTGYIGIGITPTRPLHISKVVPDNATLGNNNAAIFVDSPMASTSRQQTGINIQPSISPASASTQNYLGVSFLPVTNSANLSGANIYGALGGVYSYGSANINEIHGGNFTNYVEDTATVNKVYGVTISTPNKAAGATIATAYGLYIYGQDSATTNYAIYTEEGNIRFGGAIQLANYTSNGFVKTSNSDGTLGIDTSSYAVLNGINNGALNVSGALSVGASSGAIATITTSGAIRVSKGTAALPAFSCADDLNTGIYFSGADDLLFTTGGTARMSFNNVGTAAFIPNGTQTLNVSSTGLGIGGLYSGYSGQFNVQNISSASVSKITAVIKQQTSQTGDLTQWQDSNANVLDKVMASGAVLIGRGAPSNASILSVSGAVTLNSTLAVSGAVTISGDTTFVTAGGGLPYGACYGKDIAWVQTNAVQNTWYLVSDTDMVDAPLNLFTHDGNGKLTVLQAGTYKFDMAISMECSGTNKHLEYGMSVNGGAPSMYQREFFAAVSQEQHGSLSKIMTLAANDTVELAIRTTDTGTPDITVTNLSFNGFMVGG